MSGARNVQILERRDVLGQKAHSEMRHAGRHQGRNAGKRLAQLVVIEAALVLFLECSQSRVRAISRKRARICSPETGSSSLAAIASRRRRERRGTSRVEVMSLARRSCHFLKQSADASIGRPGSLRRERARLRARDQFTQQGQRLVPLSLAGAEHGVVETIDLVNGVDGAGTRRHGSGIDLTGRGPTRPGHEPHDITTDRAPKTRLDWPGPRFPCAQPPAAAMARASFPVPSARRTTSASNSLAVPNQEWAARPKCAFRS